MKFTVAATITTLFFFLAQSRADLPHRKEFEVIKIAAGEWKDGEFPGDITGNELWEWKVYKMPGKVKDTEHLNFGSANSDSHLGVSKSRTEPGYCEIYNASMAPQVYAVRQAQSPNGWYRKNIDSLTTHLIEDQHVTVFHRKGLPKLD
ncbi:hypothetical protein PCANC_21382 [Puccinia coronata f. sp. avenae]|jgi:hypothetical protein|uniref:Uncharacterized protein n=1 Tax=Puccinia coronata f. sp. avenae TaxID=200324 RepID=A0A2N5UBX1_9BASI|nr:hypothetical protein PCASD_15788 [Puccinia coronata f. sp. avenae]PLW35247.1 hypothetical protein PCANC_21382 [Puccinia coronata f. sp. avenae]